MQFLREVIRDHESGVTYVHLPGSLIPSDRRRRRCCRDAVDLKTDLRIIHLQFVFSYTNS